MFFMVLILGLQIQAKVVHQYFQKIESNGNHIGYAVIKEELFAKKNEMKVTTFVKTNKEGGNVTEGLSAKSSADTLAPISYQYTAIIDKTEKTIDASVRDGVLYGTITEGKSKKNIQNKLPDQAFFSSVLLPRILRKGLSEEKSYQFQAVAEEDGQVSEGKVQILEKTKINGEEAYKLVNDYKNNRFYSYVSPDGKVLKTENPITKLSTTTVSNKKEAVGSISYPEVILKSLFGKVP